MILRDVLSMIMTSPARTFSFERTSIVFVIDSLDVVSQFAVFVAWKAVAVSDESLITEISCILQSNSG